MTGLLSSDGGSEPHSHEAQNDTPPSSQGPTRERSYRSIVLECDAETLGTMLKRADFSIAGKEFSIFCDEPDTIGGDNSAPPPMAYLAAAILF